MFTGLIEETGLVSFLEYSDTNLKINIKAALILEDIKLGDSIAVNGVCLTVTEFDADSFSVTAVKETLEVTALKYLKNDDLVNLERCLRAQDRLGGHIVQGHVDTVVECIKIFDQSGSYDLYFSIEPKFSKYLINKGSICISGISLTVVKVGSMNELQGINENVLKDLDYFYVTIIPATWDKTNLSQIKKGAKVNIEVDILAKYLERFMVAAVHLPRA
ncbi:MAG: riboflavin synthase [Vampirovibrionia bacterium]|jgi:riboflavin synthase